MKARLFWPLLCLLVFADCSTKRLAVEELNPYVPHDVVGDVVRLTLAYNPGAVFGWPMSRPVLILLSLAVLLLLAHLYQRTTPRDRMMVIGLALVCGGALGNLFDRLRSAAGVVDFIDIGVGTLRFWTFNVADIGVTVGAALLAVAMWRSAAPLEDEPLGPPCSPTTRH